MDRERKKRRIVNQDQEDNDEDDDQEIEKFFALIRSNRELREHMNNIKNGVESSSASQNKQKGHGDNKILATWKPSFQPEDFMEDQHHHRHHHLNASTSGNVENPKTECSKREVEEDKNGGENGGNHGGLDLNVEDKKEDQGEDDNDGLLDLNLSL